MLRNKLGRLAGWLIKTALVCVIAANLLVFATVYIFSKTIAEMSSSELAFALLIFMACATMIVLFMFFLLRLGIKGEVKKEYEIKNR